MSCVRVYHQTEPIEALIVYLEGEDLASAIDRSQHGGKPAHDQWANFFDEVTDNHAPGAIPAVIIDWHRDTGHAVGAS